MLEIYVDGDACPVKAETQKVAARYGLVMHLVSNSGLRMGADPQVHQVVVPGGFDAVDDWIAEHIGAGDIAVTADILLARRCLDKGAAVIGPDGRPFTRDNIGSAIAMRALHADLRDMGEIRGSGRSFGRQDRSRFLGALDAAVQALKRTMR
ncbi:MAG: YaiI/YqxD family protein [Alphaproteobacteria bacterium]